MPGNCKHNILVTNYADHTSSPAAVILLRGKISSIASTCPSIVIKNLTTNTDAAALVVSERDAEFKGLLRLQLGQNTIQVRQCKNQITINITYSPNTTQYYVRKYYIICRGHDGRFQSPFEEERSPEDAHRKINLATDLVQTIFAEKMCAQGMGRKSFRLAEECVSFYSDLTQSEAEVLDVDQLWTHFAKEIMFREKLNASEKFVAVLGCTRFIPGDSLVKSRVVADAALGGGNMVIFGSGCLYTFPSKLSDVMCRFKDDRPVDVNRFMDHSNGRRTIGGCWATNLGSLCHEMGHIFNLGHTKNGIMGGGIDLVGNMFTVENRTLDLTDRIVENGDGALTPPAKQDPRLTRLQPNTNRFLSKYQEHRDNDSTHLALSSAIILSVHKWFKNIPSMEEHESLITYCKYTRQIKSETYPIRLIELRKHPQAAAYGFYSFKEDDHVKAYTLPNSTDVDQCFVFTIDSAGNFERFEINCNP